MGKLSSEIAFISPHNAYFTIKIKKIMKENVEKMTALRRQYNVSYSDHLFSMCETFALSMFDH